jgi:hypothetical protein
MAHPPNSPSPAASTPTRYATPTYHLPPPCGGVPAAASHKQLVDWSKEQLGSIPPPSGDGNIDLGDIIGGGGVQEIEQLGEIRFHVLDDSGAGHADEAEEIANEMATDSSRALGGSIPPSYFIWATCSTVPAKPTTTASDSTGRIATTRERSLLLPAITAVKPKPQPISHRSAPSEQTSARLRL